jgi:hypothetical protein
VVSPEPFIVEPQPLLERRPRRPAEGADAAAIEQLARHSVRTSRVEDDASLETHAVPNAFGKLGNGDVVSGADIDVRFSPLNWSSETQVAPPALCPSYVSAATKSFSVKFGCTPSASSTAVRQPEGAQMFAESNAIWSRGLNQRVQFFV